MEIITKKRDLFQFILQYMDGSNLTLIDCNTNICSYLYEKLINHRMDFNKFDNSYHNNSNNNPVSTNSDRTSIPTNLQNTSKRKISNSSSRSLNNLNPVTNSNFMYVDDIDYSHPNELIYVTFHFLNLISGSIAKFLKITSKSKELIIQNLCSKFLLLLHELNFHVSPEEYIELDRDYLQTVRDREQDQINSCHNTQKQSKTNLTDLNDFNDKDQTPRNSEDKVKTTSPPDRKISTISSLDNETNFIQINVHKCSEANSDDRILTQNRTSTSDLDDLETSPLDNKIGDDNDTNDYG